MKYKKLLEITNNILELVNYYCQNTYGINDFVPLEYRGKIAQELNSKFGYKNVGGIFEFSTIGNTAIFILVSIDEGF